MKRFISLFIALTMLTCVLCGCAGGTGTSASTDATDAPVPTGTTEASAVPSTVTDAPTEELTTHITFRVTHDNGELKEFELETSKTTLAEVLIDENLVVESAESSGFYDTVDGETAVWDDDEAWWYFTCNGEGLTVGIEETELIDGAVYEAIFTHGFN